MINIGPILKKLIINHGTLFKTEKESVSILIFLFLSGIIGQGYFCQERGFSEEVLDIIPLFIPATRVLWQATKVVIFCLAIY